ncbi:MAG: diacylglycerol kinase family protein, partial [Candidatus Thermoplasmatota archaeon]|nr:diacylglycerol kinase family protein [Candidatus Thermoplasmatota archaeon]
MAQVHVIVNPASRDGRCGKAWPDVRRRMENDGWTVEAFITGGPGDAARHAHHLVTAGHVGQGDLVVAVGGDGVVHEVASGLRGSGAVLGQIPFGSGNDFAITHGIPRDDLEGALRLLKEGVDRPSGAWRLEAFPAPPESAEYPVQANPWDGPAEEEGRIVRWTFLETDAGISSSISRAKLRRAKWL